MSIFIKGSHFLSILLALDTLSKSIISHGPDLARLIEHYNMIHARTNHLHLGNVFDKNGLVDQEIPCKLRFHLREHPFFHRNGFFLNPENIKLAVLSHDKHTLSCEGDLFDFRTTG